MLSLIKTNGNEKSNLLPEFPSLFDDFITRDLFNIPTKRLFSSTTIPSVNVRETEEAFELEMAAPGMDKKDFKIELEHDRLTISSQKETNHEEKNDKGKYTRKEYNYQSFSRSFNLPEDLIISSDITADYTDGILHVKVPKREPSKLKPVREIKIS